MDQPLLRDLKIEVTHQCTLACIHCSSESLISNFKEISNNDCLRIINEASHLGVKEISFSGGEPLLWGSLINAIERASVLNISSTIYTSGNIDNFEILISDIAKMKIKKFVFSLYSNASTEHDRVTRKRESFERTLSAMEITKKFKIPVEVHFVAMSNNFDQLSEIVELSKSKKVGVVSVLRFVPQGRGRLLNSASLNLKQNIELKSIIKQIRNTGYKLRTGSPWNFLMVNEEPMCLSAIDKLIIGPDMQIYPCDAFKQFKYSEFFSEDTYSDLMKHSLEECWTKSLYLNLVRNKITDYCTVCTNCSSFSNCNSGCLAQKKALYGNIDRRPDPACILGKAEEHESRR